MWRVLVATFGNAAVALSAAFAMEPLAVPAELHGRHLVPFFASGDALELAVPSLRGEPLATALWRWQGGTATLMAQIPGIRANRVRELPAAGSGRRLFLGGGVPDSDAPEDLVYGWQVVELPPSGPPRTLWRSVEVAELPAGSEPLVEVNAAGSRWAGLLPRVTAGQLTGGLLLVGELPKVTPSLKYEFTFDPAIPPSLDDEPWLVEFVGTDKLLMVAVGMPMLLELEGTRLRRTPLAVPSPPVRSAYFHGASGTLWLNDDGPGHHGFVLAQGGAPPSAPLLPTLRLGLEELGFSHGRMLGSVGNGLAILGTRDGRPAVVFVRLDGEGGLAVERTVVLPGSGRVSQVSPSSDGNTLVWLEVERDAQAKPALQKLYRAAVASLPALR